MIISFTRIIGKLREKSFALLTKKSVSSCPKFTILYNVHQKRSSGFLATGWRYMSLLPSPLLQITKQSNGRCLCKYFTLRRSLDITTHHTYFILYLHNVLVVLIFHIYFVRDYNIIIHYGDIMTIFYDNTLNHFHQLNNSK